MVKDGTYFKVSDIQKKLGKKNRKLPLNED